MSENVDMGTAQLTDAEQLAGQVRERGYCILKKVIPADVVGAVCADVLAVDPTHNRADAPANRVPWGLCMT